MPHDRSGKHWRHLRDALCINEVRPLTMALRDLDRFQALDISEIEVQRALKELKGNGYDGCNVQGETAFRSFLGKLLITYEPDIKAKLRLDAHAGVQGGATSAEFYDKLLATAVEHETTVKGDEGNWIDPVNQPSRRYNSPSKLVGITQRGIEFYDSLRADLPEGAILIGQWWEAEASHEDVELFLLGVMYGSGVEDTEDLPPETPTLIAGIERLIAKGYIREFPAGSQPSHYTPDEAQLRRRYDIISTNIDELRRAGERDTHDFSHHITDEGRMRGISFYPRQPLGWKPGHYADKVERNRLRRSGDTPSAGFIGGGEMYQTGEEAIPMYRQEPASELWDAVRAAQMWARTGNQAAIGYADALLSGKVEERLEEYRAMGFNITREEAIKTQLLYLLNNLQTWRGAEARAAKKVMRDATAGKIPFRLTPSAGFVGGGEMYETDQLINPSAGFIGGGEMYQTGEEAIPIYRQEPEDEEQARRRIQQEINAAALEREELERLARGMGCEEKVWDTAELRADFEVVSFLAPFVYVVQRSTGQGGIMLFQHNPRYYWCFEPVESQPHILDSPGHILEEMSEKLDRMIRLLQVWAGEAPQPIMPPPGIPKTPVEPGPDPKPVVVEEPPETVPTGPIAPMPAGVTFGQQVGSATYRMVEWAYNYGKRLGTLRYRDIPAIVAQLDPPIKISGTYAGSILRNAKEAGVPLVLPGDPIPTGEPITEPVTEPITEGVPTGRVPQTREGGTVIDEKQRASFLRAGTGRRRGAITGNNTKILEYWWDNLYRKGNPIAVDSIEWHYRTIALRTGVSDTTAFSILRTARLPTRPEGLSPSQTYVPPPDLGGPAPVTEEVTEQITMAPSEVPWAKPEPPLPAGNIARAKAVRAIGESGRYRNHPVEQLIPLLEAEGWVLGANMAAKLRMMVRVLGSEQGEANVLSGRNTPGNPSLQQEGETDALYMTRIMEGFPGAYRAF